MHNKDGSIILSSYILKSLKDGKKILKDFFSNFKLSPLIQIVSVSSMHNMTTIPDFQDVTEVNIQDEATTVFSRAKQVRVS